MPHLAFVQLTIRDLDRALNLYAGQLGMAIERRQEIEGSGWRLPDASTARMAYLTQPGLEGSAGLRLIQVQPARQRTLRQDVPHYHPGPFGYSLGVDDVGSVWERFAAFGAVKMSEPQFFPGPPAGKLAATEFVLQMPGSYYVMLYHVDPSSPRYHPTAANGLSEVRSVSVVSADPGQTDRFWQEVMGFELTVITDGVNDTWNTSRALPLGTRIQSGSFHMPGQVRGPVYRVGMPDLTKGLAPIAPDLSAAGCCLTGLRVEDLPATLRRARSAGYEVLAETVSGIAPWQDEPVALLAAPDGLLVELAGPSA